MLIRRIGTLTTVVVIAVLVMGEWGWAAQFEDLSAQELKTRMDSGAKILVINPLSDIEFGEGHIPGSVNIPAHTLDTTDRLPADKSTPIITYCLGPK